MGDAVFLFRIAVHARKRYLRRIYRWLLYALVFILFFFSQARRFGPVDRRYTGRTGKCCFPIYAVFVVQPV